MIQQNKNFQDAASREDETMAEFVDFLKDGDDSVTVKFKRNENPYGAWDYVMSLAHGVCKNYFLIEIKVRNVTSDAYDSMLLEKQKYESLNLHRKNWANADIFKNKPKICLTAPDIIYIQRYTDNKLRYSNLDGVEPVFTQVNCNKTTVINTGRVNKAVYMIPNEQTTLVDLS